MQEPDRARELMRAWIDPELVDVERAAVYTFHGLIAERWRAGRVFLAGDAAHQMPPFLGQGMCSGMRDAANIAWKLAAVLHDGAPDALLDTYQSEREPHVRAIVEQAVAFGRIICTTDAEMAAARDADMLAAPSRSTSAPGALGLGGGPAIGPGGGAVSAQPTIGTQRLDDVVGLQFAVVTREPLAADDTDAAWWSGRAARFDLVATPELEVLFDGAPDASAVVVRPDGYVFAIGDLADITATAQRVLGDAYAVQRVR
jgi:3-(3-hydroxy-phenyl)propionate hydroxylase